MEMVKFAIFYTAISAVASAAGFSLTIGPPVAVGPGVKVSKTRAPIFAVRLDNCADSATAKISASARAADANRSGVPVSLVNAGSPGVYLLAQDGPGATSGPWVVSITATCGNYSAGAIVPIVNQKFERDLMNVFSHSPTENEIQQALSEADKRAIVNPR